MKSSVSKLVTSLTLSVSMLSGCSAAKMATLTSSTQAEKKAAIEIVNPSYPGDYKTVSIDGIDYRQGRFQKGKFGGSLVRSLIASNPKTFNPWTSTDTNSSELSALMFATLLTTDMYTGEVIPYMAKSFEVGEDGVTYTTRLREGLTWSDGKPITADDVAFTWNTIVALGYGNSSLHDVTSVEGKPPVVTVVDKYTNKYVTARPLAPFIRVIGEIQVAPRHIIEPIIKGKDGRKKFDDLFSTTLKPETLVTSGPFVLKRFVPSQEVEFERSKNFFMVNKQGERLPYLDKLIFQFVPEVRTNLSKFRGGEIDMTQVRCRDTVDLMPLRKEKNFGLYNLGQTLGTYFVMFNLNKRNNRQGKPFVDPIKSAWFNDRNFRQAVNHAINRKAMVANHFKGLGYPSFTMLSPVSPFFNENLKGFEPDIEYCLKLLAESGFKKDTEGQLVDSKSNRVEFDLVTSSGGTFFSTISNMFIEDMKKLGIKVNFEEINFNILMDRVQVACNWQAGIYGLSGGDPFEPHSSANIFASNARRHLFDQRQPDKSGNIPVTDARAWEKRIDQLYSQGASTFDNTKRKAIYNELQKIIYDEAPFIYLVDAMNIIGARNTIKNYNPTRLSQLTIGVHNIEELYKEPGKPEQKQ